MYPQILGISGSPIKNSNTDRLVCGFGESCPMSALPYVFGKDTAVTPGKFCRVEDQEVWVQAQELGREIAARLKAQLTM